MVAGYRFGFYVRIDIFPGHPPVIASRSAALASRRVESSVGRGASSGAGEYRLKPEITTTVHCTEKGLTSERTGRPPATYVAGQPRTRRIFQRDDSGAVVAFVDRREGDEIRRVRVAARPPGSR